MLFDIPAIPIFLLFYWKGNAPFFFFFAGYITIWILAHEFGIKRLFNRHRPATAGIQPGYSFPSSHSFTSGLIIATCLVFPIPYGAVLIFLALVNAINRAAIGVHYLADITAGLLIGLLAGFLWPITLEIAKAFLP